MTAPRITWSEVPFDGYVADITWDGTRFVSVGAEASRVSAWTSRDGITWEEHEVPEQSFGELPNGSPWTAHMGPLVRLGDTLYSFGATARFNDASHGAGWRWTDGQTWAAIESASEFFHGEVVTVTASDEALVANTISFGGPRGTVATWRWTPSTSWVRASLSDTIVGGLAWSDGTFVAAESPVATGDEPSVWTSMDGSQWTEGEPPAEASDVCALTSTATGFLAFGRTAEGIAAWTWADGAGWVKGEVEPADVSGIGDQLAMPGPCTVVAIANGLIVGVLVGDVTFIWTSHDGTSWEFQASLEVGGALGAVGNRVPLAAGDRRVVLAGFRNDATEPDGLRTVLLVGVVEP